MAESWSRRRRRGISTSGQFQALCSCIGLEGFSSLGGKLGGRLTVKKRPSASCDVVARGATRSRRGEPPLCRRGDPPRREVPTYVDPPVRTRGATGREERYKEREQAPVEGWRSTVREVQLYCTSLTVDQAAELEGWGVAFDPSVGMRLRS
jgi:hypothetical protein